MLSIRTRKRLSFSFGLLGVGLIFADLLITGNFFVHIAELMAASILCLILALLLDHSANRQKGAGKS